KRQVHEVCRPLVDAELCTGCGECVEECPWDAITVNPETNVAEVKYERCAGALSCMGVCPNGAIIEPEGCREKMQVRLGESSIGPIRAIDENIFYINWTYQITAGCDCFKFSDIPMTKDVGMLFSSDPVAIDLATLELINQHLFYDEFGEANLYAERFEGVWGTSPNIHIESASKMGAGSNRYKINEL
ncbi:MAG: DUF362 domain-containing protein, partial [Methermicoccaceae archaeon]